ncbi:MAG: exodeoxyribonuclease VII large subunit [Hornefia sp.]|nr:exodeoxyribonuclease VII large subunit [Hornefia sp.]
MALKPITVTQLNEYLDRIVKTDPIMSNVVIKGELSGVKYHSSGHVYFSLIDSKSKLNCFYNQRLVSNLQGQLSDGMEVTCTGRIGIYTAGGSYSLYVNSLEIEGLGNLALEFEKLKSKLNEEGLFDPKYKKKLPFFPKKVGVITASTGAAVRDIIKTVKIRNDVCDILIFPSAVQGAFAGKEIAERIKFVNENHEDVDVLIVGRGGGSSEDLWAFNEEVVARAIFDSKIPIVSAVGHEIDFSISDLVADKRAATPTAAGQMVVPDTGELRDRINDIKYQLLNRLKNNLNFNSLRTKNIMSEMKSNLKSDVDNKFSEINRLKTVLEGNDPRRILKNGYAILENSQGNIVTGIKDFKKDNDYKITMFDGVGLVKFIEEADSHE